MGCLSREGGVFEDSERSGECRLACIIACNVVLILHQMFGGGPMAKQAGDYLAKEGVKLYLVFGLYVTFLTGFVCTSENLS